MCPGPRAWCGAGNQGAKSNDLCWVNDNATLSLNGSNTELVKGTDGLWKAAADSAQKIERLTGADNGDNDGEHWKVTSSDGTQYFFGLNKLPGAGAQRTNSAWTVPVFGNNDGEECHKNAFADSWCQQGWRWNLDYVVDPRGNAMTYFYETETNHYGRNGDVTTGKGTSTPYARGGWTTRIEYGHRSDTLFSAKAPAVVYFDVAERCLPTGTITCSDAQFTKDNAKSWPDVPVDLNCKPGTECKVLSPSFWTRKRLTTIRTQVLSGGAQRDVDAWAFEQQLPDSGDGHFPLWLASITRTGKAGADVVMPPVTFGSEQLENRVDGKEHIAPFWRRRVNKITTETGATTQVAYSARDCLRSELPDPATNTKRCYPVNWSPDGADTPVLDWFHKYLVTQVLEADNTGGGRVMQTDYEYVGAPAWLKSTDEFTKPAERTYNDYRGYAALKVRSGGAGDKRGLVETRYFRGVPGAKVVDSEGITADDAPVLAGSVRETINYNGDGGPILAAVAKDYWVSDPTASRARPALPDLTAVQTGTKTERTRSPLSDGGWRRSKVTRTFDGYGMPVQEDTEGDLAVTGDEQCLRTEYARNTTDWLVSYTSRTEIVTVGCSTTPTRPRDVLSDNRSFYDGASSYETPPTKGLSTSGTEITASGTGRQTNLRIEYDAYGRARKAWNVEDQLTTTDYSGTVGELPNTSTVTNPLGQTIKQTFDTRRGLIVTSVDVNKVRTDYEYDALGRVTKVWAPGWEKETHATKPTKEYTYLVRADGPVAVSTKHLIHNGNYLTNIDLYDSMLRPRQTQVPTQGGRIVTEKWYDSLGRKWRTYSGYFASGAPDTTLVAGDDTKVVASTETVFDGAGRPTDVIAKKYGTETVRTTTLYDGERTTTIPPTGGTASTAVLDAFGRTSELVEYTLPDRKGPQSTLYEYTTRGDMKKVVDPAGNVWSHDYDARGNDTHSVDPDKGESWREYDTSDRIVKSTSARGGTLSQTYDALGRQRQLKAAETVLAEWEFDTAPGGVGQLAASTRWADGGAYKTAITGYNARGQSTGTTITLPPDAGTGMTGPFTWQYAYNPETGLPTGVRHPALGGLPAETVNTGYDAFGRLQSTGSSLQPYVGSTTYDPLDRITQTEMGAFGKKIITTNVWDQHTGSLLSAQTDQESTKTRLGLTEYGYDPTQNVTRISDTNGQGTTVPDVQCFSYDGLRRTTQAWTATDNCSQQQPRGGVNGTVGGVDPYWQTYTYDALGSRLQETIHDTTGDTAKDLTRKYTYPTAGENKPRHALTKVVTEAASGTSENTYEYDAAGNTTKRKISGRPEQTLEWNSEGRLGKVLDGSQESNYVYDAEGRRILKRDSAGTTLYLVKGTELRRSAGGTLTGTRYYAHSDKTVAVRTGNKISFLLNDHHGTAGTTVDNATQTVTRRKTMPFGGPRGPQPTPGGWPDDKGFLGKTVDPTGLVNIGAREYDTDIGRFISVDPVMDLARPEQMQGYAYASNRPATSSDPTGLADKPTNTPTPPSGCPAANDKCNDPLRDTTKRLTAEGPVNGKPETIYDEKGIPHSVVAPGNDTNANVVHGIISADLAAAGDAYDPQTRSGYEYYHQNETNSNGLKGLIQDGPLHVVTGTTADFILVKWENGAIASVDSYDATGTTSPDKNPDEIEKEIRRKLSVVARGKAQANNVIYLATDRTQGEEVARRFSGDTRVRVVSRDGYDSRPTVRVPYARGQGRAGRGLIGNGNSIAVMGGLIAAISFAANWHRYGFKEATKGLFFGIFDPFNFWGNRPRSNATES